MTDTVTTAFAAALGFGWAALALAFLLRKSGLRQSLPRVWRGHSALARFAAVAAVVVATVFGGSKPTGSGGAASLSTPSTSDIMTAAPSGAALSGDGDATNGLRFTAFAMDAEDRFDFSVAWPATNLPEYAAIDIFHKQFLDDPAWRWIRRESVWPEDGEYEFSLNGRNLPYLEEVVSRRFCDETNTVVSPFGVTYTNIYARVPELTAAAPRSAFFMLATQRDADGDGLSDAIERSLGLDPLDPDMDGDGLPDGQELALGANPLSTDSDGDGLPDAAEASIGSNPAKADTDGDGLADGQEVSHGTNPLAVDSDGDGLSDLEEVGLVSPVSYAWQNAVEAQNLLLTGEAAPFSIQLSSPFVADGVSHSCLAVDTKGVVFLLGPGDFATNSPPIPASLSGWNGNPAHLAIAALWTELETDSLSSLKCFETDDAVVIEFSDFLDGVSGVRSGAGWLRSSVQRRVSMQVVLPRTIHDTIFVHYREIPEGGMSAGAMVGVHNRDRGYFSLPEGFYTLPSPGDPAPVPESGAGLRFSLGVGTDPTVPDTDADDLSDGDEVSGGTDPLSADTDGDGVSDGDEVASGTDPNDADDSVGYQSAFVIGNADENVPVTFSQTFSVPAGTVSLVGVWATSREYPRYTSDASEYNDVLDWTVKTNGTDAMTGRTNVNALHASFVAADDAGDVVPELTGPAVSLGMFFVEAPTNSAISVTAEFKVTNISDGALPSSLMAALYPLRVVQDNWPESRTSTDFGNRHSKRILRDGIAYVTGEPAAPQLKASFVGLPEFVDVGWQFNLTSERIERGTLDNRTVPVSGWTDVAGDDEWDIAAALNEIVGGRAVVSAQIDGNKTCSTAFFIRGKNPSDAAAREYINANVDAEFQAYAWMIAKHESKFGPWVYNQFNAHGSKKELPNYGAPSGWGIAQIDKGQNGDSTAEVYDWHENVASMNATLISKRRRYNEIIGWYRAAYQDDASTHWTEPDNVSTNVNGTVILGRQWAIMTLYNGARGTHPLPFAGHTDEKTPIHFDPVTTNWVLYTNSNNYVPVVFGDANTSEVE